MSNPEEMMTKEWKYDFRNEWEQATADLRYLAYTKKIDLKKYGFTNELLNSTYCKVKKKKAIG